MRRMIGVALALLSLTVLAACGAPRPPVGLWQGIFEGNDAMIVARLEIAVNGTVRVSAPNAFMDFAGMSEKQRADMRADLLSKLADAWPDVGPMPLSFDGKVFRKPGGVAPQMEWDPDRKEMTLIVYPGIHATIRVPLVSVSEFGAQESSLPFDESEIAGQHQTGERGHVIPADRLVQIENRKDAENQEGNDLLHRLELGG